MVRGNVGTNLKIPPPGEPAPALVPGRNSSPKYIVPSGRMAWPSKASCPTALRLTTRASVVVPWLRFVIATGVAIDVGSKISYMPPVVASSPNRIVPHGVRRIGSQLDVPVTIVVAFDAAGRDRSTRWT